MHFANAMHGSFVNEFKRSRKNGKLRGCPEKKSRSLKGFKREGEDICISRLLQSLKANKCFFKEIKFQKSKNTWIKSFTFI